MGKNTRKTLPPFLMFQWKEKHKQTKPNQPTTKDKSERKIVIKTKICTKQCSSSSYFSSAGFYSSFTTFSSWLFVCHSVRLFNVVVVIHRYLYVSVVFPHTRDIILFYILILLLFVFNDNNNNTFFLVWITATTNTIKKKEEKTDWQPT